MQPSFLSLPSLQPCHPTIQFKSLQCCQSKSNYLSIHLRILLDLGRKPIQIVHGNNDSVLYARNSNTNLSVHPFPYSCPERSASVAIQMLVNI
ncbi:hypothetical protein EYC80_001781 [Monilinia laxa]|uniref:Uncharacterized protein n=1 Tax=Monilinia laxa TaxID=61186 RepID=A0A5N6K613_MONLA|nr:hypothetical protein EYC80_001781 [Monilinia laxa]